MIFIYSRGGQLDQFQELYFYETKISKSYEGALYELYMETFVTIIIFLSFLIIVQTTIKIVLSKTALIKIFRSKFFTKIIKNILPEPRYGHPCYIIKHTI
jgi:hypothetical protein